MILQINPLPFKDIFLQMLHNFLPKKTADCVFLQPFLCFFRISYCFVSKFRKTLKNRQNKTRILFDCEFPPLNCTHPRELN